MEIIFYVLAHVDYYGSNIYRENELLTFDTIEEAQAEVNKQYNEDEIMYGAIAIHYIKRDNNGKTIYNEVTYIRTEYFAKELEY